MYKVEGIEYIIRWERHILKGMTEETFEQKHQLEILDYSQNEI